MAAKGLKGQGLDPSIVIPTCFPNADTFTGTAAMFGRSSNHATRLLIDRYGDNAAGVCGIKWKGGPNTGGHIFNWKIVNGSVEFFDGQNNMVDSTVRSLFWKGIDPNGYFYLARLDNATPDLTALGRYVQVLK